MSGSLRGADL
ncbi:hypothetical protein LINPERHAP1_LOCUS26352 [Linum perenne]